MNNNISPLNYKSLKLFGFEDYFDEIQDLLEKKKLPKVSLLSGKKGIGKSTLIFHLLNYFFSKNDYNLNHREINSNSVIFKQITAGTFQNIVYLVIIKLNQKILMNVGMI